MEQDTLVDSKKMAFSRMRLWELQDQYLMEPMEGRYHQFLSINCNNGEIRLIEEMPVNCLRQSPKTQTIFGIAGMIKLPAGVYVLVITARENAGSFRGHPIFKVTKMRVLSCSSLEALNTQKQVEADLTKLLKAAENTSGLYFSYDVDLTLNAQRFHSMDQASKLLPIWKQADPKFLWNKSIIEELIQNKLDEYILPIVQGSFQTSEVSLGSIPLIVTLIARRCMRRAGTRMWRRGADIEGNVANFVETEQLLEANGYLASYVQLRGSIPLLWEQIVDLTYKPRFKLVDPDNAVMVAKQHFSDLKKRYASVIAVDLINQHGGEGSLSRAFANTMQNVVDEDIKYVQFDFHKICGHTNFERLSVLYDQIGDAIQKYRYFLLSEGSEMLMEQNGVIRTNCIDCLDRTNVTQSMLGRKAVEAQLKEIGIFRKNETLIQHTNLDNLLKILWANHGDDISIQYSGTPALKRDFVRYGKRTIQGILGDGQSALARYYYNNFCDGEKQDTIDLLLGNYNISESRDLNSPSQSKRLETFKSIRLASILVVGCMLLAAMSLRGREGAWRFFFSAFWASLTLGIMSFVRINGRSFCNRPRLQKLCS